ncbi:MAG TPA: hypothetical protein VK020_16165 [Microlunatus sp.]|nr:hypothetical protein [Microlunatus sp.]
MQHAVIGRPPGVPAGDDRFSRPGWRELRHRVGRPYGAMVPHCRISADGSTHGSRPGCARPRPDR